MISGVRRAVAGHCRSLQLKTQFILRLIAIIVKLISFSFSLASEIFFNSLPLSLAPSLSFYFIFIFSLAGGSL